ncbi:Uma2 family endonuclease [Allocoleopsis sp.]|uniref:Uma2 family endonuclease n=1 Tax=Allocoleopsis sp. TaxID=3088169 RepID=UPI002FD4CEAE
MVTSTPVLDQSKAFSLEDYMLHPPDNTEWVDGQLVEKQGMTAKHSRVQARLARYWGNYKDDSGQGGDVYTEASCWTGTRGRRPDVSYLTPELVAQFGDFTVLPQSFSLIAEVASPDDSAEELFAKAREYLQSGCQEVWLLFPESQLVLINGQQRWILFNAGEVVSTQAVLQGFSIAINELLA